MALFPFFTDMRRIPRLGKDPITLCLRLGVALYGLGLWSVQPALGGTPPPATPGLPLVLETFEQNPPLQFPAHWQVRGDRRQAEQIYQVHVEADNHFLHAQAVSQAVQVGLVQGISPRAFPRLRWRWRVHQLPPGGDERYSATHDSAAGIYVVFDNSVLPRVLKYVWSATLPPRTQLSSPLYWRGKVIVLESGVAGLGEWHEETVNVYADYKALFGEEPGEVQGIGLMSSSSHTRSVVSADYDDFVLLGAE
jgi:hypothetical protein